jgi:(p)ppGpp synthase/HD superfamily hydrolase
MNPKLVGAPDIDLARAFAELAHAGQTYHDEVPYSFHLNRVVGVLALYKFTSPEWVCSALLHDVIEDTNRNYGDVLKRFGQVVADRVYAVTAGKGKNRHERNAATYPGIKGVEEFVILKLADRIANVEYGLATSGGKADMYAREFPEFEKGIREEDPEKESDVVRRMWDHLMRSLGVKSTMRA